MRHAKSSWRDRKQSDFDRPLNDRGRRAAPLMAQYLSQNNLTPDLALCSTAERTRETWALMAPSLPCPVIYKHSLYLASPKDMLRDIKETGDAIQHVLVIAHNPGMHMLALSLIHPDKSEMSKVAQLAGKFPTAAIASFTLTNAHWSAIGNRSGALDIFVTPKMLAA